MENCFQRIVKRSGCLLNSLNILGVMKCFVSIECNKLTLKFPSGVSEDKLA
jgi:hypothetical protein